MPRTFLIRGIVLSAALLIAWRVWGSRLLNASDGGGDGTPNSRSFRMAWKAQVGQDAYHEHINELLDSETSLFYACECEIGCIEKTTGKKIWLARLPGAATSPEPASWDKPSYWIVKDGSHLFARTGARWPASFRGPKPPPPYEVRAFHAMNGKEIWRRGFDSPLYNAMATAGKLLLIATGKGDIIALHRSNGRKAWDRNFTKSQPDNVFLRCDGRVAVAQIGGRRLIGFRPEDGKQLWEYGRELLPTEFSIGKPEGLALDRGVVYALLSYDLVALDATAGRLLWKRTGSGVEGSVTVSADHIVISRDFGGDLAALRKDGNTVWFKGQNAVASQPRGQAGVAAHDPVIVRTISKVIDFPPGWETMPDTVVAIDPGSGQELWRWQPYEGLAISSILYQRDRMYFSDGRNVYGYVEGDPDWLPVDEVARKSLALEMAETVLESKIRMDVPGERLPGDVKKYVSQHRPQHEPEHTEARLILIRLGRDSVPPLMEFVRQELERMDASIPMVKSQGWDHFVVSPSLHTALNLLVDIDDRSIVPEFARLLSAIKYPGSRKAIGEALIRIGDDRARNALFQFARAGSDEEWARRSALYFVCRSRNSDSQFESTSRPELSEVTSYLLNELSNEMAPFWLRQFARFELFNERGQEAREAAITTFSRDRKQIFPPMKRVLKVTGNVNDFNRFGFPASLYSLDTVCRCERGRLWGAFLCDYLGDDDLWFVQSKDKKQWTNPAFGLTLPAKSNYSNFRMICRKNRLHVFWTNEVWNSGKYVSKHVEIPIDDLYRDTDRDGLTDRVERRIGTDPVQSDTNGNGISDGMDKNPLYRAHKLTDEEEIYQATLEAMCQVGRSWRLERKNNMELYVDPWVFGSEEPMHLPTPDGSTGIELLGHNALIIFPTTQTTGRFQLFPYPPGYGQFTPPHIGLDGSWMRWWSTEVKSIGPRDPFAPDQDVASRSGFRFREFFPYELSRTGDRARVGWEEIIYRDGYVSFDIEVRRIGDGWYPVECQQVLKSFNGFNYDKIVTPLSVCERGESRFY